MLGDSTQLGAEKLRSSMPVIKSYQNEHGSLALYRHQDGGMSVDLSLMVPDTTIGFGFSKKYGADGAWTARTLYAGALAVYLKMPSA